MKVLFMFSTRFAYTPVSKTLEESEEVELKKHNFENIQTAFIQVKSADEGGQLSSVETKLLKNLKWVSRKNNTNTILLHSFAHLSESKATPAISKLLIDNVERRLRNSGFIVHKTPFGYFHDLEINAPGYSLARVFKSF